MNILKPLNWNEGKMAFSKSAFAVLVKAHIINNLHIVHADSIGNIRVIGL